MVPLCKHFYDRQEPIKYPMCSVIAVAFVSRVTVLWFREFLQKAITRTQLLVPPGPSRSPARRSGQVLACGGGEPPQPAALLITGSHPERTCSGWLARVTYASKNGRATIKSAGFESLTDQRLSRSVL